MYTQQLHIKKKTKNKKKKKFCNLKKNANKIRINNNIATTILYNYLINKIF